ncbi:unnamed protein product [Caenorhabditis nigoni]
MCDRFKYSHNGIFKLPNVPEIIASGNGPIEWLFEFNGVWCGICLKSSDNITNMVHPVMVAYGGETIPSKTLLFLNISSENREFKNKFKMEALAKGKDPICYPKVSILDLLNLKNGFLDENGAMTIEYGFHFEGIFDDDQEMWKFNLESKPFDGELKKNMISYKGDEILYSHKQLVLFHDSHSKISDEMHGMDLLGIPQKFELEIFEKFLQIAHGVQLKLEALELMDIISIAHRYKIQNVLKYCERQLLMNFQQFPEDKFREKSGKDQLTTLSVLIKYAGFLNLNNLLAFLLKYLMGRSWGVKNRFSKEFGFDRMKNESKKIFVAIVLYGEH